MKKAFLAFTLYLLSFAGAYAEPLMVRSGEHATFTRLVLPLPENANWSIENLPGNSRLLFEGFDKGFDLRYAFEIIPRTRLKALIARPSELVLQLSCACPVDTFIERSRFLVIDIFDGPLLEAVADELPTSSEPAGTAPALSSLPSSDFAYGELLWSGNAAFAGPLQSGGAQQATESSKESESLSTEEAEAAILSDTQERLLADFSSAVSNGLVQPKQTAASTDTEVGPEIEIYDSSAIAQEIALSPESQIRVTDSRDVPENGSLVNLATSGAVCPNPESFDVAAWGTNGGFDKQIANSNLNLIDDLGRTNREQVLKHARLYIYFGFGAEAKQTLEMLPGLSAENPELVDLANIMEFGYSYEPDRLSRYADCFSNVALWAILADRNMSKDHDVNAKAALRALNLLPAHLKFFLAQKLSNRLLELGDKESAKIAIRSFERLEENASNSPTMANAKIADLQNDEDGFEEILKEIIDTQTTEAPEAIAAIVQNHVDQNTVVPADLALLAESYAFEFKDTQLGHKMLRTFILAATKSAQFEKVFDLLREGDEMSVFDEVTRSNLVSFVFSEFTKASNDTDFIKGVFRQVPYLGADIENEVLVDVAARMLRLGFAEQATFLLSKISPAFQSTDLRILNAGLFLISGQYNEGLMELDGLEGAEVSRLRAELMEMLGDNLEAASYFEEANMPERAVSSLWLSDEWSEAIAETTPIFGPLSQLNKQNATEGMSRENMLAKSGDAISLSSAARLALQNALDNLAVQGQPD